MSKISLRIKSFITVSGSKLPLAVLIIGILLRASGFYQWQFGFDQVQIIEAAKQLAAGDLTLIGPRTGPATLFTGPLIYYLTAGFVLLGFDYYSLIFTSIFLSGLSGLAIYYLAKRYLDSKKALISLVIWCFSFFLISHDQITWNPNLTLLASSLLFFPLLASLGIFKLKMQDFIFVFIGSFLGYQAHFSGLLFLPLSLLFLLGKNKYQAIKLMIVSIFGSVLSLLPTVVFDYRHDWVNLNGIKQFLTEIVIKDQSSQTSYTHHLWKSFYTSLENWGSLLFGNFSLPMELLFVIGLICLGLLIKNNLSIRKSANRSFFLTITWLAVVALVFSFYSGDKPPYYFFIQLPAIIVIYLFLFEKIKNTKIFILIFAFFGVFLTINQSLSKNPFSLTNSLNIQHFAQEKLQTQPFSQVVFHIPQGNTFGLEYLLSNLAFDNTVKQDLYLSYPDKVIFNEGSFNGIDAWLQPKNSNDQHVYFDNSFRIFTKNNLFIYKNTYYTGRADQELLLFDLDQRIGSVEIFDLKKFIQEYKTSELKKVDGWQKLDANTALWWCPLGQRVFVLETQSPISDEQLNSTVIF